jgi:hypothetical protein
MLDIVCCPRYVNVLSAWGISNVFDMTSPTVWGMVVCSTRGITWSILNILEIVQSELSESEDSFHPTTKLAVVSD